MRLIDADKLLDTICDDQCGEHRCDSRCELAGYVENASTEESVPLVPLARWLGGYCVAPVPRKLGYSGIEENTHDWEAILRTMDWRTVEHDD